MTTRETDTSALALFRRFQPRFREITWQYNGLVLVEDEEGETQDCGFRITWRTFTRRSTGMYFKPARKTFGPCDGEGVDPLKDGLFQRWQSREHEPPPPHGCGQRPGELLFDLQRTGDLQLSAFQCEPNRSEGPIIQFELFLAQQIVELLSELEFCLGVASDKKTKKEEPEDEKAIGTSPLEKRRFTGVISSKKKLPGGFTVTDRKIPSQPWQFFVPPKSLEGQAIQAAVTLEKPGKLEDLKTTEKELLALLNGAESVGK